MRNLVVCLDGTWNTPDQQDRGRQVPSNVVKMARAVHEGRAKNGTIQKIHYDTGVGTSGWFDKLVGGATGRGIMKNILQAYGWLAKEYQDGDNLYLFGFSRGAYTARSLAGLIGTCGIGAVGNNDADFATMIEAAKGVYRTKDLDERAKLAADFKEKYSARSGNVHFVGVWDTVGALGVPTAGPLGWWTRKRSGFHDVKLGSHIKHARHAIAINEKRGPFKPTLWKPDELAESQTLIQAWFPGVHSNVGGGYVDGGLSDRALLWMINAAFERGLQFDGNYVRKRVHPNWFGELRKSSSMKYEAMISNRPKLRSIGVTHAASECLHPSASGRWNHVSSPEKAPKNFLEAEEKQVLEFVPNDFEKDFND